MGTFAIVRQFIRAVGRRGGAQSDVLADPGGGADVKAYHVQQPGDDSHSLPNDTAMLVELPRQNGFAAVGYIDPLNAQTAAQGERRLYSRDADGTQVSEIYLMNDGTVRVSNDNGFIQLSADGTIEANSGTGSLNIAPSGTAVLDSGTGSATIDTAGDITLDDGGGGTIASAAGVLTLTGTAINLVGPTNINGLQITAAGIVPDATRIPHTHSQADDSGDNTEADTSLPINT